MAFGYTIEYEGRSNWGSLKAVVGSWDADSVTSGTIKTGLNRIIHCEINNSTGNRADSKVDHTSIAGSIAISDVTANDEGTFLAIGK
jgi:hypothetical protein